MGAKDSKSALVEYGNYDLKTRLKEAKCTKRLSCTTLQLSTIPKEIPKWHHFERLEHLDLSKNKLADLPIEFDLLAKNLRHLELQSNNFSTFPQVVLKLSKLEILNLNNNKLTMETFPTDEFSAMTSLQKLHLCSNHFHALPYTQLSELAFKHALHWLSIQQNYLDLSEMHDFLEQMERSQCRVSYCHQHIPQVVWKDPSGNSSAAIYLGGVHSAENVKWLEVNRIINVLSVGEFPFKSEKIGVKRPKRTKTDDQEAAESGAPPNDENDDDEVIDGDDGSNNNEDDEEAKREAKKEASVKSLTRRIYPPHFKHVFIEIDDVPSADLMPHLDRTNDFIKEVIGSNQRILIHCAAGISRSTSVVIAYLISEVGMNYEKAFMSVRRARRCIQPNEGFVHQLRKYHRRLKKARELAAGEQQLLESQDSNLDD